MLPFIKTIATQWHLGLKIEAKFCTFTHCIIYSRMGRTSDSYFFCAKPRILWPNLWYTSDGGHSVFWEIRGFKCIILSLSDIFQQNLVINIYCLTTVWSFMQKSTNSVKLSTKVSWGEGTFSRLPCIWCDASYSAVLWSDIIKINHNTKIQTQANK